MRLKIEGLVAATFTPMRPDGSLNLDLIEQQATTLQQTNVRGAFVCGTTGEGPSLTVAERRQVVERWCAVAPEDVAVIVHVGHSSVAEARNLAAHAQQAGAAAVGAMAPFFFKSQQAETIAACCAEIAAGAPNLPFYYYHFPIMSGVHVKASDVLKIAADRIPNFGGAKFTDYDLLDFGQCHEIAQNRFDLYFGREEMLLGALAIGATACIGGTISLAASTYNRVMDAFRSGDLPAAREAQAKGRRIADILSRFGGLRAMKAAAALSGIDCGPPRLPIVPFSPAEVTSMSAELRAVGFFDTPH